jgi:hypothetical protein
MVYLAGLIFKWIAHALVPAVLLFGVGALVLAILWGFVLRRRKLSSGKGWLGLALVTLAFGGWRTWEVGQSFYHPELQMFRQYVAEPIPKAVTGLAPAIASPVMFHDGAYIAFHAPPEVVEGIVNHSLKGAKTGEVIRKMKRQSGRGDADRVVIAGPDGQSYLPVDLQWAERETSSESEWARGEIASFLKSRNGRAYVLLRSGDWGTFVSVMQYEPAQSRVVILQHLNRVH